jgi:membrane-bound serine protease (ClpP class)
MIEGTTLNALHLAWVLDPSVAYMLFMAGMAGLAFEIANPGFGFSGVVGGICLALSMAAFAHLPVNWGSLGLVVFGTGLLYAEAHLPTHGVMGVAGVAALFFGSLLLYDSKAAPEARLAWWLILICVGSVSGLLFWALGVSVKALRRPALQGDASMIGKLGVARTALSPEGQIHLGAEDWSAVSEDGALPEGARVEVVAVEGLKLRVRKKD